MEKFTRRCSDFFTSLWPAEEKRLVFGEGKHDHPRLMLIGEAPGAQEAMEGRPFVGKAGKNLDGFLEAVGLLREEIWISNVVKIRPTKVSEKGTVSNRPPSKEELALFRPYLYEEISLVSPQLVVTLGNVALKSLLGEREVIGDHHGRLCLSDASLTGETLCVFPLYHPASIIYNRSLQAVYAEDLVRLRELLDSSDI